MMKPRDQEYRPDGNTPFRAQWPGPPNGTDPHLRDGYDWSNAVRPPRRSRAGLVLGMCAAAAVGVIAVALLSTGLLGGTGGSAAHSAAIGSHSEAPARSSAEGVLSAALRAVRAAGSVHVAIALRNTSGTKVVLYRDDSGASAGRQVITTGAGGRARVLVVGRVGYIRGNQAALAGFFEFPAPVAARFAGRWISFRPGEPGYREVTSGVTIAGVIDQLRLAGPLHLTRRSRVRARPVVGVQGRPPAAGHMAPGTVAVLQIAATGTPLPVDLQETAPHAHFSATFSAWREPVRIAAPAHAIPISSITS
jgi:hypothetical protein